MTIDDVNFALPAPTALRLGGAALFLDLDGTLASIAARPQDVTPDPRRTDLLWRLSEALHGRLAVVSGRSLSDVDRILEGRVRPVAAVHGLVRRRADGGVEQTPPHAGLPEAVTAFSRLAADHPGLLVEDKGRSVALHFRQAPHCARLVHEAAGQIAGRTGLARQEGSMVTELRTPGPSKGDSVRAFLTETPFRGATPVFMGDDVTDEDGFAAVEALGGYGVLVGPARQTHARFRLDDVDRALGWLEAAL